MEVDGKAKQNLPPWVGKVHGSGGTWILMTHCTAIVALLPVGNMMCRCFGPGTSWKVGED